MAKNISSLFGLVIGLLVVSTKTMGGTLSFDTPERGTYLNNGESSQKVDLVFISEGYRLGEMAKFHNDVIRAVNYLFTMNPYKDRKNDFNVHWVNAISVESGSDDPSVGVFRNTAFDSYYSGRLLSVGNSANISLAKSKVPESDTVVILVNYGTYGGAGYYGSYATSYNGSYLPQVASHEMGHSFGILGDEYHYYAYTYTGTEPIFANMTVEKNFALVKWSDLVGFNGVSTYQGGMNYYRYGVWRPTSGNCQMRQYTNVFCNVCLRKLNREIGRRKARYAPEAFARANILSGPPPLSVAFTGYATDADSSELSYEWRLGAGSSSERNPFHTFTSAGNYPVRLTVRDELGQSATAVPITITVNTRPVTPGAPTGPSEGAVGTSYTFSAVTTDPELQTIQYTFAWGDGKYSTTAYTASGVSASASHAWTAPGTHKVQVLGKDSMGWGTSWSAVLNVVIQ